MTQAPEPSAAIPEMATANRPDPDETPALTTAASTGPAAVEPTA